MSRQKRDGRSSAVESSNADKQEIITPSIAGIRFAAAFADSIAAVIPAKAGIQRVSSGAKRRKPSLPQEGGSNGESGGAFDFLQKHKSLRLFTPE
ncbi:MAG: hypothetical protein LBI87_04770 [Candidatus Accumulibacter sp.]|nr:hypothetical protein [Accumulibacter sp.]